MEQAHEGSLSLSASLLVSFPSKAESLQSIKQASKKAIDQFLRPELDTCIRIQILLLMGWPWAKHITPLSPSFLVCKMISPLLRVSGAYHETVKVSHCYLQRLECATIHRWGQRLWKTGNYCVEFYNIPGNIPQGTVFSVTSSPWRLSSAAQKYFARETVFSVCRRDGQRPVGGQPSSLDLMIWNQKATEL